MGIRKDIWLVNAQFHSVIPTLPGSKGLQSCKKEKKVLISIKGVVEEGHQTAFKSYIFKPFYRLNLGRNISLLCTVLVWVQTVYDMSSPGCLTQMTVLSQGQWDLQFYPQH